jgi:hypothetical protein
MDSTFQCEWILSGGYGTGGFLSVGHDLNAKNQNAARFSTGKIARTDQRELWPVRRRIFTAGSAEKKRNRARKTMGKLTIERRSQLWTSCICSSTTKSPPRYGRDYHKALVSRTVGVSILTADTAISRLPANQILGKCANRTCPVYDGEDASVPIVFLSCDRGS